MPELTPDELDALLARVAQRAVRDVLKELGLEEETAAQDMREIRGLLEAWRDTKRTIWGTVVKIGTGSLLAFIAGAMWMAFKDGVQK